MIIFFGLGQKFIKGFDLLQEKCQHCNEGKLVVFLFCRYFQIFWIPIFPIGKFAQIQCQHCKALKNEYEMTDEEKAIIKEIKTNIKYPKICFIGLFIIIIGVIGLFLMGFFK